MANPEWTDPEDFDDPVSLAWRFDSDGEIRAYDEYGDIQDNIALVYGEQHGHLIAAAPKLFEALGKSALALDEASALLASKGLQGCASIMSAHADLARAVLAKVEAA